MIKFSSRIGRRKAYVKKRANTSREEATKYMAVKSTVKGVFHFIPPSLSSSK